MRLVAARSANLSAAPESIGGQGRTGHLILAEDQLRALERSREEKTARGEIETEHPGYLGAQDTYYVGTIKSIGRIYQQTFIDTYSKVAFAKLYDRKNALVAAGMLNDRVVPFFDQHEVPLLRVLTDRGTEYCGNRESHEYQLYLAVENIDHSRTKAKSTQTTTASVNVFTARSRKSFTALRFAKSSTAHWTNCKATLMNGSPSTTQSVRTPVSTAMARPRCRASWTRND